jgi:hypothetical protein
VRFELAACHRLPPEIVDVLAHDEDVEVVAAVAASQELSPALAAEFAGHPAQEVRRSLLFNVHIEQPPPAPDMAADLAVLAAKNPRTPHAEVLAGHATAFVREEVARRPDLPPEVCERLAADEEPSVRAATAGNAATPAATLRRLAAETDRAVLRELAHNPAIPLDLLVELAPRARLAPVAPPRVTNASDAELRVLAAHPAMQVRKLVAERPNLPQDVLTALMTDQDPAVAKAAKTQADLRKRSRACVAQPPPEPGGVPPCHSTGAH